jgi:hypothetical protein
VTAPSADGTAAAIRAITTDLRYSLRDGRFVEVDIDPTAGRALLVINVGDLQVGHRQLRLQFEGAAIVPDDYQRLSSAIRAEFRSDHWHRGRVVTEVLDQKVTTLPEGRHRMRIRLRPFHTFAIEFDQLVLTETPLAERGPARPGQFRVVSSVAKRIQLKAPRPST